VQTVGQLSSLSVAGLKKSFSGTSVPVAAGASLHSLRRLMQKFLGGGAAMLAASRKIHRCFERVNQLLSLLVPVSDINRAAAGRVAAQSAVACANSSLAASFYGVGI